MKGFAVVGTIMIMAAAPLRPRRRPRLRLPRRPSRPHPRLPRGRRRPVAAQSAPPPHRRVRRGLSPRAPRSLTWCCSASPTSRPMASVATTRIQALQQKKAAELNDKKSSSRPLQQKLEKEGARDERTAPADLQKQIERLQRRNPALHAGRAAGSPGAAAAAAAGIPAAPRAGAPGGRPGEGPALHLQRPRRRPGVGRHRASTSRPTSSRSWTRREAGRQQARRPPSPRCSERRPTSPALLDRLLAASLSRRCSSTHRRARAGAARRGQERHRQRRVLPGPFPRHAADARRC